MNVISGSMSNHNYLSPVEQAEYRSLKFAYGIHMQSTLNELLEQWKTLQHLKEELKDESKTSERIAEEYKIIVREIKELEAAINLLCIGFDVVAQA